MNRKSLLALLLVLCMTLSSCALVTVNQDVDDATPIVTVGEKVYTKAEVKAYVDNYLTQLANSYYQNYGYTIDTTNEEVIASAQDEVIHSLVEQEVVSLKLAEMGFDTLTDEEKVAFGLVCHGLDDRDKLGKGFGFVWRHFFCTSFDVALRFLRGGFNRVTLVESFVIPLYHRLNDLSRGL